MREMLVPAVIQRRHQTERRFASCLQPCVRQLDPRAAFNGVQLPQQLCHHAAQRRDRERLAQTARRAHLQHFTPATFRALFFAAVQCIGSPNLKIRIRLEKSLFQFVGLCQKCPCGIHWNPHKHCLLNCCITHR